MNVRLESRRGLASALVCLGAIAAAAALTAACGGSVADAPRADSSAPGPSASTTASPSPDAVAPDDFADPSHWSTFDTAALDGRGGHYNGAAFDGRFVYLVPGSDGVVPRYDTRAPFGARTSWSSFDASAIDTQAGGFRGAAFDGRYVYFVPYSGSGSSLSGAVVRYDTHEAYESEGAWSSFDVASLDARAVGYFGAAFDGRYLYLAPLGGDGQTSPLSGVVARLDTQATFTTPSAWTTFDATGVDARAKGFQGATFDGRYVYFSPYANGWGDYSSTVTRYDTRAGFGDPSSWSTFDTRAVSPNALGFFGASFDGRYAYFVPYEGDGSQGGRIARYDALGGFDSVASWSTFDTSPMRIGPAGAVFDGRYLYLVPSATSAGPSGHVGRLDTRAPFTSASSWSTFDTTTLDTRATWFFGGAFDGENVYLVPSVGTIAVQFRARTSPAMPRGYDGSFY